MGPAHIGIGLAAKRAAPRVPLAVLIASSEVPDILFLALWPAGIERMGRKGEKSSTPWSHGLLMNTVWSGLAGVAAARFYRSRRTGILIGGVVFSHWLLDFIAHDRDLPLLLAGSREVGLGLEMRWTPKGQKVHWLRGNLAEVALLAAGFLLYRGSRKNRG